VIYLLFCIAQKPFITQTNNIKKARDISSSTYKLLISNHDLQPPYSALFSQEITGSSFSVSTNKQCTLCCLWIEKEFRWD